MKKKFKLFVLIVLSVISLTACSKEGQLLTKDDILSKLEKEEINLQIISEEKDEIKTEIYGYLNGEEEEEEEKFTIRIYLSKEILIEEQRKEAKRNEFKNVAYPKIIVINNVLIYYASPEAYRGEDGKYGKQLEKIFSN